MVVRKKGNIGKIFLQIFKIILRIVLLPIVIIYLFAKFVSYLKNKKKNKDKIVVFSMSQIDNLSGRDFELFLKQVFEKMGYRVETTKTSYDYGADLVLKKSGKTSVVQAKCYGGKVGVKAIQEIVSAKNHYGASEAFVATNSTFSSEAEAIAIENGVKLIDRPIIQKFLEKYQISIDASENNFSALDSKSRFEINQRYKGWI